MKSMSENKQIKLNEQLRGQYAPPALQKTCVLDYAFAQTGGCSSQDIEECAPIGPVGGPFEGSG